MAEVKFVLKGFLFALVLVLFLQINVGGETLEVKSDRWLHHSAVATFLNKSAEGAAVLLHKASMEVSRAMSDFSGKKAKSGSNAAWGVESHHDSKSE